MPKFIVKTYDIGFAIRSGQHNDDDLEKPTSNTLVRFGEFVEFPLLEQ